MCQSLFWSYGKPFMNGGDLFYNLGQNSWPCNDAKSEIRISQFVNLKFSFIPPAPNNLSLYTIFKSGLYNSE